MSERTAHARRRPLRQDPPDRRRGERRRGARDPDALASGHGLRRRDDADRRGAVSELLRKPVETVSTVRVRASRAAPRAARRAPATSRSTRSRRRRPRSSSCCREATAPRASTAAAPLTGAPVEARARDRADRLRGGRRAVHRLRAARRRLGLGRRRADDVLQRLRAASATSRRPTAAAIARTSRRTSSATPSSRRRRRPEPTRRRRPARPRHRRRRRRRAGRHAGAPPTTRRAGRARPPRPDAGSAVAKDRIPTSRIARTARVARLAAGQGTRQLGTQAANLTRDEKGRQAALERRHLEAAEQIVTALGTMKGAAMKMGQVLSFLDVGLVPEEYRDEFQRKLGELRDAAPKVRFSDMRKVIESELEAPLERDLRALRRGAGRRGLDRPGLPRAAAGRPRGGGQGPVPGRRPGGPGGHAEPRA